RERQWTWRHRPAFHPLEHAPEVIGNVDRPSGGAVDHTFEHSRPRHNTIVRGENLVEEVRPSRPTEHPTTAAKLLGRHRLSDVAAHHLAHADDDAWRQHLPAQPTGFEHVAAAQ